MVIFTTSPPSREGSFTNHEESYFLMPLLQETNIRIFTNMQENICNTKNKQHRSNLHSKILLFLLQN